MLAEKSGTPGMSSSRPQELMFRTLDYLIYMFYHKDKGAPEMV